MHVLASLLSNSNHELTLFEMKVPVPTVYHTLNNGFVVNAAHTYRMNEGFVLKL